MDPSKSSAMRRYTFFMEWVWPHLPVGYDPTSCLGMTPPHDIPKQKAPQKNGVIPTPWAVLCGVTHFFLVLFGAFCLGMSWGGVRGVLECGIALCAKKICRVGFETLFKKHLKQTSPQKPAINKTQTNISTKTCHKQNSSQKNTPETCHKILRSFVYGRFLFGCSGEVFVGGICLRPQKPAIKFLEKKNSAEFESRPWYFFVAGFWGGLNWGFFLFSLNTLKHTATHCNTLQHTATHCNTLQHSQGRHGRIGRKNSVPSGPHPK